MKRSISLILALAVCIPMLFTPAAAEETGPTKAEIQAKWRTVTTSTTIFESSPSITAPFAPGELTDEFLESGITYLNFVRFVAGLPVVALDDTLNTDSQYGAVCLAAIDTLTHYPFQPEGMDDAFYNRAYGATTSANISARWGYNPLNSLQSAVSGCMDDNSSLGNLSCVGHRRWLLNPTLGKVGFGYARSAENWDYIVNHVFDRSGPGCEYDFIAWPVAGNHPTNLFHIRNPWSITLNTSLYATPSADSIEITITRESDGKTWSFDTSTGEPTSHADPYMIVNTQRYGIPNCIIFHPGSANVDSYEGIFTVDVTGLFTRSGSPTSLHYQVDFFDINKCDHDYTSVTVEPTCTEPGCTTYTCALCGDSYTVTIPALDHSWGAWYTVKEPTCTETGSLQRDCSRCSAHQTERVDALGHQELFQPSREPTCTESGLSEGLICSNCGFVFKEQVVIPALGHDLGEYVVTTPQSCVTDGEEQALCSRCDYIDKRVIPADGNHNYCIELEETRIEPTCTVDGSVQLSCACGAISPEPKILYAMGHDCPNWTVVREATCDGYGSMEAPCINCDEFVDTKSIPMLGHLWDEGTVTTEPTETAPGVLTYTCTREGCGDTYTEVIPALGHTHTPERVNAEEATCTWDGYTGDLVCTGCGMVLEQGQVIEAPGHAYDHWELISYPGQESSGYKQQICSVCGEGHSSGVMYPEDPHPNGHDIVIFDSKYSFTTASITRAEAGHHVFLQINPRDGYYVEAIYYGSTSESVIIEQPRFYGDYLYFTMPDGELHVQIVCRSVRDDGSFQDVDPESFYYDPFLWALEHNITTGTSPTTFSPGASCIRAQVVTFLWRAAGSPEPTSTNNPFTDVKEKDFFYKAVLWAVENGITTGLDATHFGPGVPCNRAQVVTFLWRTAGSPEPTSANNPFTDVEAGQFCFDAVLWAVEQGITNGVSDTEFGAAGICNRAQIVTFLYRTFA